MTGKYSYSLSGERYTGAFATREEALKEAVAAAQRSEDAPQTVFVGRIASADSKASGHARIVLANMAARAREEFGDAATGYLTKLTKPQIETLDAALENTINQWLHENSLSPTYSRINAIGEYPVPAIHSDPKLNGEPREVHEIGSVGYES
jgi:hypothetical protein